MTRQPEFPRCAVMRTMARFGVDPRRARNLEPMLELFERDGRSIDKVIRAVLEGRAYTGPVQLGEAALQCRDDHQMAPSPLDLTAASHVIGGSCASCHDSTHRIDLSVPVEQITARTWKLIAEQVQSGAMPPPFEGDVGTKEVEQRFPLDVEQRAILTRAAQLVALQAEPEVPSERWSPPLVARIEILRSFARRVLPGRDIEPLLRDSGLANYDGSSRVMVELRLERAAYAECTAAAERLGWNDDAMVELVLDVVARATLGRPANDQEASRVRAQWGVVRANRGSNATAAREVCAVFLSSARAYDLTPPQRPRCG